VDARADVWSLGAVFYELITGRQPFQAEGLAAVCMSVMMDEPRSARELAPELPAEIEPVLMRCLEKLPDARYQSVAELASALAPFGSDGAREHAQRAWRLLCGRRPSLAEISPPSRPNLETRSTVSLLPATVTASRNTTRRTQRTRRAAAAVAVGLALASAVVLFARGRVIGADAARAGGVSAAESWEPEQRSFHASALLVPLGPAMAIREPERVKELTPAPVAARPRARAGVEAKLITAAPEPVISADAEPAPKPPVTEPSAD
jgi:hypothetical protein